MMLIRSDPKTFAYGATSMRLAALPMLLTFAVAGLAEDPASSVIPKRYAELQGEWIVASVQNDKASTEEPPQIFVNVSGMEFTLSGSGVTKDLPDSLEYRVPRTQRDNPYRVLHRRGARELDGIVDVENQIAVFWFVGIYKWTEEGLHLALKYCGQGVEGKHFRDFRPPSSFDDEPLDGEVRLVLTRKETIGEPSDARETSASSVLKSNSAARSP